MLNTDYTSKQPDLQGIQIEKIGEGGAYVIIRGEFRLKL